MDHRSVRASCAAFWPLVICPPDNMKGLRSRKVRPLKMKRTGAKLSTSAMKARRVLAHWKPVVVVRDKAEDEKRSAYLPRLVYMLAAASGSRPATVFSPAATAPIAEPA